MKKHLVLILMLLSVELFAQYNSATIKLGYFNPSATDGGFIIGFNGERFMDESFNIGWSVDWFNKNYVDESLVKEFTNFYGIPNSSINELRAKTNLHDLPLMLNISSSLPLAPRVRAYFTAGAGLEVLLIFYRNFQNPNENEFKSAFDFSWRLGGGILFEVGRRSDILFELSYHSSSPSWTYQVDDPQNGFRRTFERRFDMSGIMTRLGFRFFY